MYKDKKMIEKVKLLFLSVLDVVLKGILYVFLLSFVLDKWHYIENLLPLPVAVMAEVIVIVLILPIISILTIDKLMGNNYMDPPKEKQ